MILDGRIVGGAGPMTVAELTKKVAQAWRKSNE
jgi:hypothetical protein